MPESQATAAFAGRTTEKIARFAVETSYEDLPADVVHAVRRSVLDSIGVAIAGRPHEAIRRALQASRDTGGAGKATVFGESTKVDLYHAALVNGMMAHVLDWDDSYYPTRLHQSAALVPPLLAAGEASGGSGRDLVLGHAVGFEVAQRMAAPLYPDFGLRGWHATGIVGAAAGGAAVGTLLKLDVQRMIWAIGLGAGIGVGKTSALGSMAKSLILGHASASGLQVAYLARNGFTSHPDMLGPAGSFLDKYADNPSYATVAEDLGSRWAVLDNGFKPYPCGMVAHAAIDAAIELRGLAPERARLQALRLRVSPETLQFMGNPDPQTGLQSKFSARYAAAVAFVDGQVGPQAFEDDAVTRADYQQALTLTTVASDVAVAQQEAFAEADTADGWHGQVHVPFARGTVQQPLTDEDLNAKFLLACTTSGYPQGAKLADLIWNIEDVSIADLTALLSGGPAWPLLAAAGAA